MPSMAARKAPILPVRRSRDESPWRMVSFPFLYDVFLVTIFNIY